MMLRAARRGNPFESLSPASLARVYEWPREALRFLDRRFDCLHVVGDCGMGKTTLLRQIEHRLAGDGVGVSYACVPLDGRLDLPIPSHSLVALVDETDRLSRRALADLLVRLREARCGCVLAGHRRQLAAIRRAGLTAAYTELAPVASEGALRLLFERRVALALGADERAYRLTDEAARALLRASGGNIERCLQIGYEVFEDLPEARAITAGDIKAAAANLRRALADASVSR